MKDVCPTDIEFAPSCQSPRQLRAGWDGKMQEPQHGSCARAQPWGLDLLGSNSETEAESSDTLYKVFRTDRSQLLSQPLDRRPQQFDITDRKPVPAAAMQKLQERPGAQRKFPKRSQKPILSFGQVEFSSAP